MGDNSVTVKLGNDATLPAASAIHKELLEAVETGAKIELDLGDVQMCDLTLLQLIVSTQKTVAAKGGVLEFVGMINTEIVKLANQLSLGHPDGAGEDWPW